MHAYKSIFVQIAFCVMCTLCTYRLHSICRFMNTHNGKIRANLGNIRIKFNIRNWYLPKATFAITCHIAYFLGVWLSFDHIRKAPTTTNKKLFKKNAKIIEPCTS